MSAVRAVQSVVGVSDVGEVAAAESRIAGVQGLVRPGHLLATLWYQRGCWGQDLLLEAEVERDSRVGLHEEECCCFRHVLPAPAVIEQSPPHIYERKKKQVNVSR